MKKYLIFDFDGTLVDSSLSAIKTFNLLAEKFNFRKVSSAEIPDLRKLTSKQLIKFFNIPLYKMPRIIFQARLEMANMMPHLLPINDLKPVLYQLYQSNYFLGILTSNSHENVELWLKKNELNDLFNFIYTESSYLNKGRILKKLLKSHKIEPKNTFYIGDETRDIEAAKQSQISSIAVCWGFNSEQALLESDPDYLIKNPYELLEIFK